jgi:ADP-ribose pyrophosphatase YjhB (NUDIX family)
VRTAISVRPICHGSKSPKARVDSKCLILYYSNFVKEVLTAGGLLCEPMPAPGGGFGPYLWLILSARSARDSRAKGQTPDREWMQNRAALLIPKGKVEPHERIYDTEGRLDLRPTAEREVREETGIPVVATDSIGYDEDIRWDPKRQEYVLRTLVLYAMKRVVGAPLTKPDKIPVLVRADNQLPRRIIHPGQSLLVAGYCNWWLSPALPAQRGPSDSVLPPGGIQLATLADVPPPESRTRQHSGN